jgi:hypothetical protein
LALSKVSCQVCDGFLLSFWEGFLLGFLLLRRFPTWLFGFLDGFLLGFFDGFLLGFFGTASSMASCSAFGMISLMVFARL